MLDMVKHITINDKEYPLAFTLNVMESVQEKYGTIAEWGKVLQPTEKVIDETTGKVAIDKETGEEIIRTLEPKIKDIIWTFKEFVNEGIDIENEEKSEKRQFLTSKQVGRLISNFGMLETTAIMQGITVGSMKNDDSKNEQTTQMTETNPA